MTRIFRVRDTTHDPEQQRDTDIYVGTVEEAKANGGDRVDSPHHSNVEVSELEVQTDKQGVLSILQGTPICKPIRTWRMTASGEMEKHSEVNEDGLLVPV